MKLFRLLFSIIAAVAMASCGSHDGPGRDEPVTPQHTRTIMVYMAADNTLGSGEINHTKYDELDIAEMLQALRHGSFADYTNVVVYHAAADGTRTLLRLERDSTVTTLREYTDVASSLVPATMKRIIGDMRQAAPADSYGLVLWSHGSGWMMSPSKEPEARSWGIEGGKEMSIPKLAEALRGEPLDFIYFDCCYMGNIETLYQLRGITPYIVASPTETPLKGMPYNLNLPLLARLPDADCTGAAASTYNYYMTDPGFSQADRSIAIAVYRMEAIDSVAIAARAIMQANRTVPAGYVPQRYGTGYTFSKLFFDMRSYMEALTRDNPSMLEAFDNALGKFVVYHAETPYMWSQLALTDCHGVSSYILPASGYDNTALSYQYPSLDWARDVVEP